MNTLYSSLIFPDTDIFNYRQFPLLLFGSPLYFLQPVEPDHESEPTENQIFLDKGLCRPHLPAPLQKDRQRFVRLIDDIRERKDDYAAQLSTLTMAAMSERKEKHGGEERHQIISSLLGSSRTLTDAETEEKLDLWQARLVLAVAEILKQEKDDLVQEMQLLDAQEMEMFRSLQGEAETDDEDPFAELQRIKASLEEARPRELRMCFQSWLRLMRKAPLPDISLWLASSAEAADELINEFDKRHDDSPVPILELSVPDRIMAGTIHVVSQVSAFLEDSASIRSNVIVELDKLVSTPVLSTDSADNLLPSGGENSRAWAELIEDHFPAGSHGSAALLFYLLPRCDIAALLELDSTLLSRRPVHGLLAVMKRTASRPL